MNNIILEDILKKIEDLPTLPNIINKVMKVLENPYSNAENLTEIISLDQSLTLKTLRLANSAYYGFPREIETVTEAIVVLGFLTVRNLILTSTLYNFFIIDENSQINFDRRKFWKHSISTAIIARKIISFLNKGQSEEEEAFTLGILHDVGHAFLDIYFHDKFVNVLKRYNDETGQLIINIEREILGIDHCEIAVKIIDKWNLPLNFVEPIKYHHEPEKAKENIFMTNLINMSNNLSKYINLKINNSEIEKIFEKNFSIISEFKKLDYEKLLHESAIELSQADLFINS